MAEWGDRDAFQARKRAAGQSLVAACEDLLGVEGPAALARVSQRSKAWWCKLRAGTGGDVPAWDEMEASVLPADLAPERRTALKLRHRVAWLLLHDPDFLADEQALTLPDFPIEHFSAVNQIAQSAIRVGDYRNARQALKLVTSILEAAGTAALSRERLQVLARCLCDLGICERYLGCSELALRYAVEAVGHYQHLESSPDAAKAVFELGLAQWQTGDEEGALEQFSRAERQYRRLGQRGEVLSCQRERAQVLIRQGHLPQAERLLLQLLVQSDGLHPRYRYPTLLSLAEACVRRRDFDRARHWLDNADALMKRHGDELALYLLPVPLREKRVALEQDVARLEEAQCVA